ncbi:hypothetical protein [Kribbella shirazensis]|uniref:Uncharacterized protein n=1 Tax=Kribbella shirazensis TaxID=1105143 RepID=A0A7X5VE55_9ACTN|nr:hypothetical protein [Kribbella shirazensis]NIK59580.1 hypothetical protein [Kribbella shirazensis]
MDGTIKPRLTLIRRFAEFTGEFLAVARRGCRGVHRSGASAAWTGPGIPAVLQKQVECSCVGTQQGSVLSVAVRRVAARPMEELPMTISWFQLSGGSYHEESGPVFSGAAEDRLWEAFPQLEADVLSGLDGARWLLQGGYERVSVGLQFRTEKKGRQRRAVAEIGRLITVDYSIVWPELENATVENIRNHVKPFVMDALELVGEKKKLGHVPRLGEGRDLTAAPLKPLIEDPTPYADEPGDSFVITRELPPGLNPSEEAAVLKRYEEDLDRILSKHARSNIIELETTASTARWVVPASRSTD